MSHRFDDALARLGLTLPPAPAPAANYVPHVIAGGMLYVSGQISQSGGALIRGRLGEDMDIEAGAAAARGRGGRERGGARLRALDPRAGARGLRGRFRAHRAAREAHGLRRLDA
jgi:hypothetical protein